MRTGKLFLRLLLFSLLFFHSYPKDAFCIEKFFQELPGLTKPRTQKPSIQLNIISKQDNITFEKEFLVQAKKAYVESGFFSHVIDYVGETDFTAYLELSMIDSGEQSSFENECLPFISCMTCFCIPFSASAIINLKTTLKNKYGKVAGIFEKSAPLFFSFSLFTVSSAEDKINKVFFELNQSSIEEAHQSLVF